MGCYTRATTNWSVQPPGVSGNLHKERISTAAFRSKSGMRNIKPRMNISSIIKKATKNRLFRPLISISWRRQASDNARCCRTLINGGEEGEWYSSVCDDEKDAYDCCSSSSSFEAKNELDAFLNGNNTRLRKS